MSRVAQIAFLLFAINFVNGRQDVPNGKSLTCQKNGDYCQIHSDCCSGKCMTYLYSCAALAAPPTFHIEKPVVTTCQRNWYYCQDDSECCSGKCSPFHNTCISLSAYPFPYLKPNLLQQKPIIDTSTNQVEIVTLPNEGNTNSNAISTSSSSTITTGSTDDKEKATSFYGIFVNKKTTAKPKECRQIGEDCYTSEECCSKRCLFYSHKCVT